MRKLAFIVIAALAAVIVAACGSSTSNLTGKDWHLTAITEKVPAFQGVVPAEDQGKYTITFNTDETYNGKADCNVFAGTYKTTGSGGLTISAGPSTLAFCPDGSYSDLFIHALTQAESYAVANDQLTITLQDGGMLVFVVGTPGASASAEAVVTASPTASPTPTADAHADADAHRVPDADAHADADAAPTATPKPSGSAKPTATPTATPTPRPPRSPRRPRRQSRPRPRRRRRPRRPERVWSARRGG